VSFANVDGGIIVLGVRTEKSQLHHGDEVISVSPFDRPLVDADQYHKIIEQRIYPSPERISIEWHQTDDGSGKGIASIVIPTQRHDRRPFLIREHVEDNSKTGLLFAHYERRRDTNRPSKIEEIHSLIRDGVLLQNILDLRERSEREVERTLVTPVEAVDRSGERNAAINEAIEAIGLTDSPIFAMVCFPNYSKVQGAIRIDLHGIKDIVEDPPILRDAGFDLRVGQTSRIIEGRIRRSVSANEAGVDVRRDGVIVFAEHCELLAHKGRIGNAENLYTINPLALGESAYLFVKLCHIVYDRCLVKPIGVTLSILLRKIKTSSFECGLIPGPVGSLAWKFKTSEDVHRPPKSECNLFIDVELGYEDMVGEVVYELVRELYSWYGFEEKAIPYVRAEADRKLIDPDLIREAGK
jgi:hypothetical protein